MRSRIFITGATGFVGLHLIRLLNSRKNEIYGTSYPEEPKPLDLVCRNELCHLDIRREQDILGLMQKARPDWIFHLAAVSNVGHSWKRRKETLETNLIGTQNIFEAVRRTSPEAKVLFVSSSDVYGKAPAVEGGLREENLTRALNPYAYSKICGELLSRFYAEVENLNILITRPFPHTGPGQSRYFVCSDWAFQIARIEKGLSPPVIKIGNIESKRDFSDVRDVVRAYALLMKKGKKGEIYNVSSGKVVALKTILDLLFSFSPVDIGIEIDSQRLRKTDIDCLIGDNGKLIKETGWNPKIPLKKTLLDLLEYWRARV